MIQDIYPHVLNNAYNNKAVANDDDYVLVFNQKGEVYTKILDEIEFPLVKDVTNKDELVYLFNVDDRNYFLCNNKENLSLNEYEVLSMHGIREIYKKTKYKIFAVNTAKHLFDWYRDNKYCGRCGAKMHHDDKERAMACDCGYKSYPRIMPAVIVGVLNGDKILVTRYRTGYGHNALIAGFTEIGETVEETVAREVMEEASLKVKNIRYYKSQPWGVANDILIGYYCNVDGDSEIKIDENELKYGAWVNREELELQPDDYSLTNEMMMMFKQGKY